MNTKKDVHYINGNANFTSLDIIFCSFDCDCTYKSQFCKFKTHMLLQIQPLKDLQLFSFFSFHNIEEIQLFYVKWIIFRLTMDCNQATQSIRGHGKRKQYFLFIFQGQNLYKGCKALIFFDDNIFKYNVTSIEYSKALLKNYNLTKLAKFHHLATKKKKLMRFIQTIFLKTMCCTLTKF